MLVLPRIVLADPAYPDHPIRLVVGYAPGGSVDAGARIVADMLQSVLGATVIVENTSGAAGTIAAQRVAGSRADGYTLLAGSSNELAATAALSPSQGYDPLTDLTAIALVGTAPVLLAASPRVGVKSMHEFVELVRGKPGSFSYGSSGVGSTLHFAGELLKQRAGLVIVHVPYRSAGTLAGDLANGDLDFAMISPTAAAPFLQGQRIVALGVTSSSRLRSLPELPALAEHPGLEKFDISGWLALAAPRDLPRGVAARLRQAVQAGLADPVFRRSLEQSGLVPATGHEDVELLMREERARYAALARFAGMTP